MDRDSHGDELGRGFAFFATSVRCLVMECLENVQKKKIVQLLVAGKKKLGDEKNPEPNTILVENKFIQAAKEAVWKGKKFKCRGNGA